jgi:hypothetical protein
MLKKRPVVNKWKVVDSSTIHSYCYINHQARLLVRFKNKDGEITSMYQFDKVPRYLANDLDRSDSVGKLFHAEIKGKFDTGKIYG